MSVPILRAIVLGLVQGLTEYIPVSSSAHLIIVPWIFGWSDPVLTNLPFDVALHLGTLLAVLTFFAKDWVRLGRAAIDSLRERQIAGDPDRRLAWLLVVGCIPGGIAGVFGESKIEHLFHPTAGPIQPVSMIWMAVFIVLLGAALYLSERLARHTRSMDQISLKDTLWIGLAQAAAIFPGVSRSGSTITAGLAVGLKRETAARFSFLLSAPIIAGAGLKSILDVLQMVKTGSVTQADLLVFPAGFIAAAISGYLCIKFLLHFLQHNTTLGFVYYRWGLAAVIVFVALRWA